MAKSIHRLEENGNAATDRKEILKNIHYFYETLYTSQKISEQKINHYLKDFNPPTLDTNMFEKLDMPIQKKKYKKQY